MDKDELISLSEAAELLKVHVGTLRRWDKNGKLIAVKVNDRGDRRFNKEDVLSLVNLTTPNPLRSRHIETYNGWQIYLASDGFEKFTDRFGLYASFVIKNGLIIKNFAFAVSGSVLFAQPEISGEDLLFKARKVIKKKIDEEDSRMKPLSKFRFYPPSFLPDDEGDWWKAF